MVPYIDLHTHHPKREQNVVAVYNHLLPETLPPVGGFFSAGLHPWHAGQVAPEALRQLLEQYAKNTDLVAFGETGLDKVCKVPMTIQKEVFEIHLLTASFYRLPVIVHCVRAWQEVIEMTTGSGVPIILHGYDGTPELTDQLVRQGFYFSIGKAILNPGSKIQASIPRIPVASLFGETDESEVSIREIYSAMAKAGSLREEELKIQLYKNFSGLNLPGA